jgi:hypothetical protein
VFALRRYALGAVDLGQWHADRATGGGDCEMRLGQLDQLPEDVGEQRTITVGPDSSADDDTVSQILLAEHDPPPCTRDTRLTFEVSRSAQPLTRDLGPPRAIAAWLAERTTR